jgi:hypothetical protein
VAEAAQIGRGQPTVTVVIKFVEEALYEGDVLRVHTERSA